MLHSLFKSKCKQLYLLLNRFIIHKYLTRCSNLFPQQRRCWCWCWCYSTPWVCPAGTARPVQTVARPPRRQTARCVYCPLWSTRRERSRARDNTWRLCSTGELLSTHKLMFGSFYKVTFSTNTGLLCFTRLKNYKWNLKASLLTLTFGNILQMYKILCVICLIIIFIYFSVICTLEQ